MTLSDSERLAIINYRIEKAHNTLVEAKYVAQGGFWSLVASRLYYAAFYLCLALLIKNGFTANTHAGVNSMISLHFVHTGKLSKDEGRLIGKLFRMRQTGDYDDLTEWSEEDILPIIPKVEALMNKIESLITDSE